jgi:hypothetical protein
MDLAIIGWVLMAWLLVSIAVSLAAGRMFQQGNADADLEQAVEHQRVVRYLRQRKAGSGKAAKLRTAVTRTAAH